jgi:hypothetical protein
MPRLIYEILLPKSGPVLIHRLQQIKDNDSEQNARPSVICTSKGCALTASSWLSARSNCASRRTVRDFKSSEALNKYTTYLLKWLHITSATHRITPRRRILLTQGHQNPLLCQSVQLPTEERAIQAPFLIGKLLKTTTRIQWP